VAGEPCVASPLYKQHFALRDGRCLEEEGVAVRTWAVKLEGQSIYIRSLQP
jgi:nitrite reductase (NADH) small subunit